MSIIHFKIYIYIYISIADAHKKFSTIVKPLKFDAKDIFVLRNDILSVSGRALHVLYTQQRSFFCLSNNFSV